MKRTLSCEKTVRPRLSWKLLTTAAQALFAHRSWAGALENRVVPVRARSLRLLVPPQRFWPKQVALPASLPGLATRKPMLLFSLSGLSLFRFAAESNSALRER